MGGRPHHPSGLFAEQPLESLTLIDLRGVIGRPRLRIPDADRQRGGVR